MSVNTRRAAMHILTNDELTAYAHKFAADALDEAANDWAADPDAWGDNEKDYRNELRDRATVLREAGS